MAQAVEFYAGHQRAGVDLLWYKFFQQEKGSASPLLFFSRTRANTDYQNSPTAFGTTEAVSWNFKGGWGIVAVGAFNNAGFTPKGGVQLVRQKGNFLFFGWLVADLKKEGNLDLFGLFRYQPVLRNSWHLFSQLELFPVYQPASGAWNLTERLRLGAKYRHWAAGGMADFNQTKTAAWIKSNNIGLFVRHDF